MKSEMNIPGRQQLSSKKWFKGLDTFHLVALPFQFMATVVVMLIFIKKMEGRIWKIICGTGLEMAYIISAHIFYFRTQSYDHFWEM